MHPVVNISLNTRGTRAHRTQDATTPTCTHTRLASLPHGHPGLSDTPWVQAGHPRYTGARTREGRARGPHALGGKQRRPDVKHTSTHSCLFREEVFCILSTTVRTRLVVLVLCVFGTCRAFRLAEVFLTRCLFVKFSCTRVCLPQGPLSLCSAQFPLM